MKCGEKRPPQIPAREQLGIHVAAGGIVSPTNTCDVLSPIQEALPVILIEARHLSSGQCAEAPVCE
jgi:hypothetical protein